MFCTGLILALKYYSPDDALHNRLLPWDVTRNAGIGSPFLLFVLFYLKLGALKFLLWHCQHFPPSGKHCLKNDNNKVLKKKQIVKRKISVQHKYNSGSSRCINNDSIFFSPSYFPIHIAKLLLPYIRVSACIYTLYKYNIDQKCWTGNNLRTFPLKALTGDVIYTYIFKVIYKCLLCMFVYKWSLYIRLVHRNL